MLFGRSKTCRSLLAYRIVRLHTTVLAVAWMAFLAGCGDSGAELGSVTGTVTLDGEPLTGTLVEFQPEQGAPSRGRTDDRGQYELAYTRDLQGATIGSHAVRITTFRRAADERGRARVTPERLPERYHSKTTLTAEVDSGSNVIDFDIEL